MVKYLKPQMTKMDMRKGKPVLLIGICVLLSGVIAVVLPKDYAISIAVVFILFIAVVAGIWLYKIQKRFS